MNRPWFGTVPTGLGEAITQATDRVLWRADRPWEIGRVRVRGGRRAPAVAFATVLAVCAVSYPLLPRRYEAYASVVLQPTDLDGQADRTLRQPLDENAVQSEVDLIASPAIAERVIEAHHLRDDPEFAHSFLGGLRARLGTLGGLLPEQQPHTDAQIRRLLADHLQATRDRKSYTIRLGYWSQDPAKAAAMTATLLSAYLEAQRARKQASVAWLSHWLDERALVLTERYDASRRRLDAFLASSGLIDTGAQVELDQRLQVLSNEAAQAKARFIDASSRAETLAAMRSGDTLASAPEILASSAILKLKDGLAAALSKTAVWSAETSAFERQIRLESDRIVDAARAEATGWSRREELLEQQIAVTRRQIVARREAERTMAELQRVADSDRLVMEDGLAKLKGMTARAKVVEADSAVLSEAEAPASAAFPKAVPTLLAALVLAGLAALAFAWRSALDIVTRLARA